MSDYPYSVSNTRIPAALEEPKNLSEVTAECSASGDTGGDGVHPVLAGHKIGSLAFQVPFPAAGTEHFLQDREPLPPGSLPH